MCRSQKKKEHFKSQKKMTKIDYTKFDTQTVWMLLYSTEHSALDKLAHAYHNQVSDFVNDTDFSVHPKELRAFYEFVLMTALQLLIDYFYCGKETEKLFEIYSIRKVRSISNPKPEEAEDD